jgi:hypothetical protein
LTLATVSKNVKFHLYHDADGGRIHEKRICEQDGQEVPWKRRPGGAAGRARPARARRRAAPARARARR